MTSRLLVAEDEAILRLDLCERLAALGHHVVGSAASAPEAVRLAQELRPDLVVMDIRLADGSDGVSAAEQIARDFGGAVVFLTAYADESTLARAKAARPYGYLHKPVSDRDLSTAVEVALARAESDRRLVESERRYAATLESIADAVITADDSGRVTGLNPVAERLTGWSESDAVGRPGSEVVAVCDAEGRPTGFDPFAEALARRTVVAIPEGMLIRARSGRLIPVEDSAAPIVVGPGERPLGAVLAFRDVSARREAEAHLRQVQKLESLGVLTGGIAHDFNNLLTPVLGYAGLLIDLVEPGTPQAEFVRQIEAAARRAADLTRQLLAYAGKGVVSVAAFDLNDMVREMSGLLTMSVAKGAEMRLHLAPGPLTVEGDRAQLSQVLMNLILNASEALPPAGGRIEVSTDADGGQIRLRVRDTGQGMDAATLKKIFDPFFTTKFTGRGLGLSAVHGIVAGHRGKLAVESEPDKGSTFEVRLPPASHGRGSVADGPHAAAGPDLRGRRILVADDEPAVRGLFRSVLSRLGAEVLEANDFPGAARVAAQESGRLDAVILDFTMPGGEGPEALDRLRRADAGVPVVLVSGYDPDELRQRLQGRPVAAILRKPCAAADLARVVAEVFATSSGERGASAP